MNADKFEPVVHDDEKFMREALKKPGFKEAYDALEEEYSIIRAFIKARKKSKLTQQEVAEKMHISRATIGRIESPDLKHMPSMLTIIKYAHALNCKIELKLKPMER